MSELFGRMLARAAGRAPTVRAALAPRGLPGSTLTEAALEREVNAPRPTPPPGLELETPRAARSRPSQPIAVTPGEPTHRPDEPAPVVSSAQNESDQSQAAQISQSPRGYDTREIVVRETVEVVTSALATPEPARSLRRESDPIIQTITANPVVTTVESPTVTRRFTNTSSELEHVRVADSDDAEPAPARHGHAPAPKLDLRDALAAVGRALARPVPQAAPVSSPDQDVHISIGHIEVRAPTPAPAPVAAVRRAPSITLADYLRRRPGAGR